MTRWCDFDCEHATFPDAELLGACRTMAAVFCKKLGKVVPKHTPCRAAGDSETVRVKGRVVGGEAHSGRY